MSGINGSGPLHLSNPQRARILDKCGLGSGWVLLSVSEMHDLHRTMQSCQKEVDRLNKQTARLMAQQLVQGAVADKALRSARDFCAVLIDKSDDANIRIDALAQVAHLEEALSVLPTPKTEDEEPSEPGKEAS